MPKKIEDVGEVVRIMKSICFICNRYPNVLTPTRHVFVQKLAWQFADMGIECSVISPVPVNQYLASFYKLPTTLTETTNTGALVKLFFPRFISFGQKRIAGLNTARLTSHCFYKAVKKTWQKFGEPPQVVYGHFLSPAGISAGRIGKEFEVAAFAAYGESTPWSVHNYGKDRIRKELSNLKGIVSVSTANKNELQELNVLPMTKVKVFPNGIRSNHFYPQNKEQARKKFGFDQDVFLIAFLGQFSERKGVFRLEEAVKGLADVKVAFAGMGKQKPNVANCVFNSLIKPFDVPDFLSAADVFVLPTLQEGCSNAIIEAMACGLPVISSDLPFNEDILNVNNAILIDPNNIDEIRNAIIYLKDNPSIRLAMSKASLVVARQLTIDVRAKNIRDWMEQMM